MYKDSHNIESKAHTFERITKALLLIKRCRQEEGSQLQTTLAQLRGLVESLSKSSI